MNIVSFPDTNSRVLAGRYKEGTLTLAEEAAINFCQAMESGLYGARSYTDMTDEASKDDIAAAFTLGLLSEGPFRRIALTQRGKEVLDLLAQRRAA